jgi:hypothetical protein
MAIKNQFATTAKNGIRDFAGREQNVYGWPGSALTSIDEEGAFDEVE